MNTDSGVSLTGSTSTTHAGLLPAANMTTSARITLSFPLAESVLFVLFTTVCIVMTIIGNTLVILSVFTYKPLKNVPNFFIVSLAVADLAVALLVMPFNVVNFIVGRWIFGVVFCNMWLTFDILICTASILNLCAIAIDRYYAIHDPLSYAQKRTMRRVLLTIAIVWLISGLISVPPLFGWNNSSGSGLYNQLTGVCQLTDERGYVIYSALGSFFIPLAIMSFVYINIFIATRRRLRQRANAAAAAKLQKSAAVSGDTSKRTMENNVQTAAETSSTESAEAHHKSNNSCPQHNDAKTDTSDDQKGSPDTRKLLYLKPTAGEGEGEQSAAPPPVQQFLAEKQRISLSKERRAARTMAIIMTVFVLCWLPFFIMYVAFAFCARCAQVSPWVIQLIVWLGYINSTLNPIIYTIFNLDFRRAFKRLLQGKVKFCKS